MYFEVIFHLLLKSTIIYYLYSGSTRIIDYYYFRYIMEDWLEVIENLISHNKGKPLHLTSDVIL